MPFKSSKQRKACFATDGFNGKIDCREWARETKKMNYRGKKKQLGGSEEGCKNSAGLPIDCITGEPIIPSGDMAPMVNPLVKFTNVTNDMLPPEEYYPAQAATPPVKNQQQQTGKDPGYTRIDPFFALRGLQTGAQWLGGMKERGRQNQYMYDQYTTLGQNTPISVENFQPNPYNLYAQKGGTLNKARKQLDNIVPPNNYFYSGTTETDNPTSLQSMMTMIEYMKNNWSDQADTPSNIYRPQFQHITVNEKALPEMPIAKKGGWIQKALRGARKDKPCTGSKFGSSTCPPGSRRYNLAKTFRKMAKD